ncbi:MULTISPECIES: hypothetical protein [unclassified Microcoleus]
MIQVCWLWSISGNVRSGGFLLGRSGDAMLLQFMVVVQLAIICMK